MANVSTVGDGNRWGAISSYTIRHENIPIQTYGDASPFFVRGLSTIEFTGIAPATPETIAAIAGWGMDFSGDSFPIRQREWLCLYCGGANGLDGLKCIHCNAVRNWLLG